MSGSYNPAPPTALTALTVAGVPTIGVGGMPPFTGNQFWVNESTGNDGNAGTANAPLLTLTRALALCTANQNDVVWFTGTIHLSDSLVWSKNQVHLVGLCDPLKRGKRARISVTGSTAFGPLVSVTASGCWFMNFGTFFGFAVTGSTSPICWQDTGGRNCYDTVEFLGFGDSTVSTGTAVQTGARAFKLNTSTGEVTWRNCVFGVDTIARNATNYTLEIAGGAPRCTLQGCDFESDLGASGGSSCHILIGASGIDRYLNIRDCIFGNATKSSGTAMTQCYNVNASAGGYVLMHNCTGFGFTHWETSASGSVLLDMGTVTAHDGGIAIAAAPA
jgi:hypothetical protein